MRLVFCRIRNSRRQSLKEKKVKFILGWLTAWRNAEENIFISHPFLDSLSFISILFAFCPCAGVDRMLSPILLLWHHGHWPARLLCPWDFPGKSTSCYCSIARTCLTLCDSVDCSIPGDRPPCPSPSPGVCPSSRSLNQWCHPTISFSATLFSFCLYL